MRSVARARLLVRLRAHMGVHAHVYAFRWWRTIVCACMMVRWTMRRRYTMMREAFSALGHSEKSQYLFHSSSAAVYAAEANVAAPRGNVQSWPKPINLIFSVSPERQLELRRNRSADQFECFLGFLFRRLA